VTGDKIHDDAIGSQHIGVVPHVYLSNIGSSDHHVKTTDAGEITTGTFSLSRIPDTLTGKDADSVDGKNVGTGSDDTPVRSTISAEIDDDIAAHNTPSHTSAINAQDIVDARNKIGATTEAEAQAWVNCFANNFTNVVGLGERYKIGDILQHSHDDEASITSQTETKLKTITLNTLYPTPSTLRIKFDLKSSLEGQNAKGVIYKNGTSFGTERYTTSTTYVTFSEDLEFAEGDTIELWAKHVIDGATAYVRNFRIYGDVQMTLAQAISLNDVGVSDALVATNS
ncbi:MAG: hypothetical protein JRE40_12670, partial [Deltaproteobacteria bacterium]|nr:hypothetical protein [Deltaproteobacteria bacterium]